MQNRKADMTQPKGEGDNTFGFLEEIKGHDAQM